MPQVAINKACSQSPVCGLLKRQAQLGFNQCSIWQRTMTVPERCLLGKLLERDMQITIVITLCLLSLHWSSVCCSSCVASWTSEANRIWKRVL